MRKRHRGKLTGMKEKVNSNEKYCSRKNYIWYNNLKSLMHLLISPPDFLFPWCNFLQFNVFWALMLTAPVFKPRGSGKSQNIITFHTSFTSLLLVRVLIFFSILSVWGYFFFFNMTVCFLLRDYQLKLEIFKTVFSSLHWQERKVCYTVTTTVSQT